MIYHNQLSDEPMEPLELMDHFTGIHTWIFTGIAQVASAERIADICVMLSPMFCAVNIELPSLLQRKLVQRETAAAVGCYRKLTESSTFWKTNIADIAQRPS